MAVINKSHCCVSLELARIMRGVLRDQNRRGGGAGPLKGAGPASIIVAFSGNRWQGIDDYIKLLAGAT